MWHEVGINYVTFLVSSFIILYTLFSTNLDQQRLGVHQLIRHVPCPHGAGLLMRKRNVNK